MRIRNEESEILVVHRPNPQQLPNVALPFYPRSVGHFKIRGREREFVPAGEKPFVQLFWTVRGEGRCRIAGETVPVVPATSFIICRSSRMTMKPGRRGGSTAGSPSTARLPANICAVTDFRRTAPRPAAARMTCSSASGS
ncbi:MAG: hypothetical protein V8T86_05745 [Victivallis sp.]